MAASARTAAAAKPVFSAPSQRRPPEKLGWEGSVSGILSPAPAFNDPAAQEQKEEGGCQTKNNGTGVLHTAVVVFHLTQDVDAIERLAGPGLLQVQWVGHEASQEKSQADGETDHGRDDLVARERRGET